MADVKVKCVSCGSTEVIKLGISKDTFTAALKEMREAVHPVNEAYLKKNSINQSFD